MVKQSMIFRYLCVLVISAVSIEGRKSLGGSGGLMSRNLGDEPEDVFDAVSSVAESRANQLAQISRGWYIPPLNREKLVDACGSKCGHYVADVLGKAPLSFKLSRKMVRNSSGDSEVKFYRAQAKLGSFVSKQSFRSIWTVGTGLTQRKVSQRVLKKDELLAGSYEEAMSRLYPDRLELEILLPRTRGMKKAKVPPPSVVYSFPMGQGEMNSKGSVSRGRGTVYVFPEGRRKKKGSTEEPKSLQVDSTTINLHSGPSVIDYSWAKGRKVFWKGRKVGQL